MRWLRLRSTVSSPVPPRTVEVADAALKVNLSSAARPLAKALLSRETANVSAASVPRSVVASVEAAPLMVWIAKSPDQNMGSRLFYAKYLIVIGFCAGTLTGQLLFEYALSS